MMRSPKSLKVKFPAECVSNEYFLKMSFPFNFEVFLQKNQENLSNLEKLENMTKKEYFENNYHPFKRHLYQNVKAGKYAGHCRLAVLFQLPSIF